MVDQVVVVRLTTGTPQPAEGECEACGFDALHTIGLHSLHQHGVSTLATITFCGRCGYWPRASRT